MKIEISEIAVALDLILSSLVKTGQTDIDIEKDWYWDIRGDVGNDLEKEPTEHTVGSISDDIGAIRRIVKDGIGFPADLKKISNVIRAIGAQSQRELKK